MQTIKAWLKKRNVVIFLAQIGIYFMLTATWCVVFLLNYDLFFPRSNTDHGVVVHLYYYQFAIIWLVLNYVVAIAAISVRYFIRQSDLRKQLLEEKQRNTEAELAWLKNQLNPHFLFNTLNNISSLTQIDADEAQNSIGELSDLLRYALYETQQKEVSLCGEIAFMENYISLMALRCDKNVKITTHFDVPDTARTIAPMLFLSPIENAFKHGVSSGKPSFIDISLTEENGFLVFSCQNSNHPKDSCDRSGSGIGIENMRKRLELMYTKRYEMSQTVERGVYKLQIKIRTRS